MNSSIDRTAAKIAIATAIVLSLLAVSQACLIGRISHPQWLEPIVTTITGILWFVIAVVCLLLWSFSRYPSEDVDDRAVSYPGRWAIIAVVALSLLALGKYFPTIMPVYQAATMMVAVYFLGSIIKAMSES